MRRLSEKDRSAAATAAFGLFLCGRYSALRQLGIWGHSRQESASFARVRAIASGDRLLGPLLAEIIRNTNGGIPLL